MSKKPSQPCNGQNVRSTGNSDGDAVCSLTQGLRSIQLSHQHRQTHGHAADSSRESACWVCAENAPQHWAVHPCQKSICAVCAVRLRVLYDTRSCPWCKRLHDWVFITSGPQDPVVFPPDADNGAYVRDPKHGLLFADRLCKQRVLDDNLRIVCSRADCTHQQKLHSRSDLKRHAHHAHGLWMCDVCVGHRRCFAHELSVLGSKAERDAHMSAQHLQCPVCRSWLYGEDELLTHCRECHELCHLCQRRQLRQSRQSDDRRPADNHRQSLARQIDGVYFADFAALEAHFRRDHFVCTHALCLEAKFVAFESELEYRAHVATVHHEADAGAARLQRSQQRQLRRLDVAFGVGANTTAPRVHSPSPPMARPPEPVDDHDLDWGEHFFPAGRAHARQSWLLDTQRNRCAFEQLRAAGLCPGDIRTACRAYQDGSIDAPTLAHRLHLLVPDAGQLESLVAPALLDLQSDHSRRLALSTALQGLLSRIKAFPPLPRQTPTSRPPLPSLASLPPSRPFVGRIVSGSKRALMLGAKPVHNDDPARHPSALLAGGSIGRPMPSLAGEKSSRQPIKYNTVFTGLVDGNSSQQAVSGIARRDERDFPSLAPAPACATAPLQDMPVELQEDSFVIGTVDNANSATLAARAGADGGQKPKSRKWKSVLRIGL